MIVTKIQSVSSALRKRSGCLQVLLVGMGLVVVLVVGYRFAAGYASVTEEPQSSSLIQSAIMPVGELERTYLYHVPPRLAAKPALVLVFHAGGIDAEQMREITAYEFERLADAHGFIVAYPNGYEKSWNGCRKHAPYPANMHNIDDLAFVRALIEHFRAEFGVDASCVFAMGFSNGGHLAYRLALEMPNEIAAIAAIGANLPAEESCDCHHANLPIAVMIVNGTADRINPYEGGEVALPNGANLGKVLSAQATADYFRQLAGYAQAPAVHRHPDADSTDDSTIERLTWDADRMPEISLLTISSGGHTIPQDKFVFPALYGATNRDINSLEEIWQFFARQISKIEVNQSRKTSNTHGGRG